MKTCIMIVSAALTACGALGQQAQSDAAIVKQFFPPALLQPPPTLPNFVPSPHSAFVTIDLERSGRADYVAALYTNGDTAKLRLIKKTQIGPVLVAEPSSPPLFERTPRLQAIDLNGDGIPEVEVSLSVGNRSATHNWFFIWNGTALVCMNPSGAADSDDNSFYEANVVDFDGDGRYEVLEPDASVDREQHLDDQRASLYRLVGNRFSKAADIGSIPFYSIYRRHTAAPFTASAQFEASPGSYVLRVLNGTRGAKLVDSAIITLNGIAVVSPSNFKQAKGVANFAVTLAATNSVSVDLRSAPGSELSLLFLLAK
jgi:hypothetical protein